MAYGRVIAARSRHSEQPSECSIAQQQDATSLPLGTDAPSEYGPSRCPLSIPLLLPTYCGDGGHRKVDAVEIASGTGGGGQVRRFGCRRGHRSGGAKGGQWLTSRLGGWGGTGMGQVCTGQGGALATSTRLAAAAAQATRPSPQGLWKCEQKCRRDCGCCHSSEPVHQLHPPVHSPTWPAQEFSTPSAACRAQHSAAAAAADRLMEQAAPKATDCALH